MVTMVLNKRLKDYLMSEGSPKDRTLSSPLSPKRRRPRHLHQHNLRISFLSWTCFLFLSISVCSWLIAPANGFLLWDWKFLRKALQLPPLPPSGDAGGRSYRQITAESATSASSTAVGMNDTAENELVNPSGMTSSSSEVHTMLSNVSQSQTVKRIVTPMPPTTESPLKPLVDTEIQLTRKCFDFDNETNLCVENSEDWFHILHRPISLLPFDRDVVNTRFILYTKNTTAEPKMVTANKTVLLEANFNPKLPTKFIVHGFIDTGFSSWVIKMAQSLVKERDYNVLAVDWGAGSLPLYTQATANARLVGLEVGYFINYLQKYLGVDPANVHIIGHSLGAHIAGYAGERVEGLGRITGLDPAEPYFQNMPEFVRLDPSDAKLVDTIHTDSRSILLLGYGMSQPCGHVDFYPNDGFQQPGCEITDVPMNLIQAKGLNPLEIAQREVIACNHNRAIYYFLESITNKCQYIGHACDNYRSYLKGECYACGHDGSLCAIMGLDADKYYHNVSNRTLVKFYVSTSKNPPYCLYHYRVKVQLAFPLIAAEWVTGKLKITIEGDKNKLSHVDLTPEDNMRLDHGKNFTFLVQSHMKLGVIKKVSLDWTYSYNYYDLMSACWAFLCNSKLFVKRIEIVDMDELVTHAKNLQKSGEESSIFHRYCGEEGTTYTGIQSATTAEFDRLC